MLLLVVLLLGGGGAFLLQRQLEAARSEAADARKATGDVTERLRQAEDAKQGLEVQLAALKQKDHSLTEERDSLTEERDSLSQSVQAKDAELEQLKGTYKTLEEKLQEEIKKGDVHLTEVNGKIRVDLVDQILFDSGQAALSARGGEVLTRVGGVLSQVGDRQIQVSGHTDDSPISERLAGTYPTNWELSTARAVNVVRYLAEHAGVPAKRLLAAGYGPYAPVASNATVKGRSRNRRIEIVLMPPLAATANPALASAATPASSKKVAPASPAPKATTVSAVNKKRR
jgi:chemotaxis protein MotB